MNGQPCLQPWKYPWHYGRCFNIHRYIWALHKYYMVDWTRFTLQTRKPRFQKAHSIHTLSDRARFKPKPLGTPDGTRVAWKKTHFSGNQKVPKYLHVVNIFKCYSDGIFNSTHTQTWCVKHDYYVVTWLLCSEVCLSSHRDFFSSPPSY